MQRPRQFPAALGASFGVMLACYTALAGAGYWYWVSQLVRVSERGVGAASVVS